MRRVLGWAIVGLLLFGVAGLIWGQMCPAAPRPYLLPSSQAAPRMNERMAINWPSGCINPNTASAQQLETLPGIGTFTAWRIIYERVTDGFFLFPQDLLAVPGVGPDTLSDMWDQLCFPCLIN